MAKGTYIGVSSKAKKVKKMYVGIGGKAKKVKKAYIGVGGKAKLFWSGADGTFLVTFATSSFGGGRKYVQLNRSNMSMSLIQNNYGIQNVVYCQGRWFALKTVTGYETNNYLTYSTDGNTWTNFSIGIGFDDCFICADDEYVYVRTRYQSTFSFQAVNATTLAVTQIYGFTSSWQFNRPITAYDGKILLYASYYDGSQWQYQLRVITRSGSSFSPQILTIPNYARLFSYGSSNEKTLLTINNRIAYYKNGAVTVTQIIWNNYIEGAGVVYGNGKFTDGLQVSSDGIAWNGTSIGSGDINVVGYGDGAFIRTALSTFYNLTYYYSEDGITWTQIGEIESGVGATDKQIYCAYDISRSYGDK